MKYRVLVSEKAVDDVIRNAKWWAANHSLEQAAHWEEAIFKKIYSLEGFPESHPIAYESTESSIELREALFGLSGRPGYRILFTVRDDFVYVLTVKASQERWLNPDELEM